MSSTPRPSRSEELILCEAPLDALTFWCAGFRHVTTTCGANGFTAGARCGALAGDTKRVLIAYDRDDAGERGARAAAERLSQLGIASYRVLFPRQMDANLYAQKVQPAGKSLDLVLRQGRRMDSGSLPSVVVPADLGAFAGAVTPAGLAELATEQPQAAFPLAAEPFDSPRSPPRRRPPSLLPAPPAAEMPIEVGQRGDAPPRRPALPRPGPREEPLLRRLESEPPRLARRGLPRRHPRPLLGAPARSFVKQAATELGIDRSRQARPRQGAAPLEELQEETISAAPRPQVAAAAMTEEERAAALALLEAPTSSSGSSRTSSAAGVVGEETNKLLGYLAAVSRKLDGRSRCSCRAARPPASRR